MAARKESKDSFKSNHDLIKGMTNSRIINIITKYVGHKIHITSFVEDEITPYISPHPLGHCPNLDYAVRRFEYFFGKIITKPPCDLSLKSFTNDVILTILTRLKYEQNLRLLYPTQECFDKKITFHIPDIIFEPENICFYINSIDFKFNDTLTAIFFMTNCLVDAYNRDLQARIFPATNLVQVPCSVLIERDSKYFDQINMNLEQAAAEKMVNTLVEFY